MRIFPNLETATNTQNKNTVLVVMTKSQSNVSTVQALAPRSKAAADPGKTSAPVTNPTMRKAPTKKTGL